MLTNTDATLYHRRYNPVTRLDEWGCTYIPAIWWYEAEQSSVTTEGRKTADTFTVRIPDITVLVKKDDYLVKGQCSVQMKRKTWPAQNTSRCRRQIITGTEEIRTSR